MKQYLDLARAVKEKGTYKAPARDGMPGTTSLFGYQFRHDLSEGFPLLTTKKLSFKNIVYELLWFLRGDTNIKYLVDNGCNIWNEDAYNYYLKQFGKKPNGSYDIEPMSFEQFVDRIKNPQGESRVESSNYKLGDCGKQYGWLWRNWGGVESNLGKFFMVDVNNIPSSSMENIEEALIEMRKICKETGILPVDLSSTQTAYVDQIKELIKGLKENPYSRRHIITAWNPSTLDQMALNACHALAQFNCRPLSYGERNAIYKEKYGETVEETDSRLEFLNDTTFEQDLDNARIPKYRLDCQMYQRSADLFLGVPYNIASYALLTHILAKVCNMIPGDFIHTFGDVHIYDNHMNQINEQLSREERPLPTLEIVDEGNDWAAISNLDFNLIEMLNHKDFILKDYNPHSAIKGELSTGLKK